MQDRRIRQMAGRRGGGAILLTLMLSVIWAAPVSAVDNGTVAGTVTVAGGACLQVVGTFAYGTLPFEPDGDQTIHGSEDVATITNCDSSAAAQLFAHGTTASSSTNPAVTWALGPDAVWCGPAPLGNNRPLDVYTHIVTAGAQGPTMALTSTDASFDTVAVGEAKVYLGTLYMPCQGSSGAGDTMTFSVVFTAIQN